MLGTLGRASWEHLGDYWDHLAASWRPSWVSCAVLGPLGGVLVTKQGGPPRGPFFLGPSWKAKLANNLVFYSVFCSSTDLLLDALKDILTPGGTPDAGSRGGG